MITYDIVISKQGAEWFAVEAENPTDALLRYENGEAKLKGDQTTAITSLRVFETGTGMDVTPAAAPCFLDSSDECAEFNDELVTRSAPRWAWGMIDEYLDAGGGGMVKLANAAMTAASERADNAPISPYEAKEFLASCEGE